MIDGRGWRSGAVVEQRELTQWFLRITDYSEDLLGEPRPLDRWPEKVRLMQRNWIGRSEGLLVRFASIRRRSARSPANRRRANSKSTRPVPTRCSARGSWRSRPTIRWRAQRRRRDPALAGVHRGMPQGRDLGRRDRDRGEEGLRHGPQSACIRSTPSGACRSMSPISC